MLHILFVVAVAACGWINVPGHFTADLCSASMFTLTYHQDDKYVFQVNEAEAMNALESTEYVWWEWVGGGGTWMRREYAGRGTLGNVEEGMTFLYDNGDGTLDMVWYQPCGPVLVLPYRVNLPVVFN